MKISAKFSIMLSWLAVLCCWLFVGRVFAEELISIDKALKKIFKNSTHFDKKDVRLSAEQMQRIEESAGIAFGQVHSSQVMFYTAYQEREILGYAFEDTVLGKWGPIHYLLGINKDGSVAEGIILDYQEIRGRPVAKRRFLRQYNGKTIDDSLRLRDDIDGVTGATISSRSLTDGIRKLLHIFKEKGSESAQ